MNNMTGDPNHENRPSVFSFEPYPSRNFQPIDWNRIPFDQSAIPTIPLAPPGVGQFGQPFQHTPIDLGNFSFCSTQTPHPAQFPFPNNVLQQPPPPSPPPLQAQVVQTSSSKWMRCKRKTDSPPLEQVSVKQHITEEKMAEHMSKLHISSEMATTSKETDTDRTKRLYMCEEMRKLQNDTILPQSLLSRIQRPCTALVLWQPPRNLIALDDHRNNSRSALDENENNGNNNEESVPDHNRIGINENCMDLDQL